MPRLKDLMHKSKFNNDFLASLSVNSIFGIVLIIVAILILQQTVGKAPSKQIRINSTLLSSAQHAELNQALEAVSKRHFITTELEDIQKSTSNLSWVDEVSITRDWHRGITLDVLPKQAVAKFGSEKYINADGDVFYPANIQGRGLSDADLVTLQGPITKSTDIMKQMQLVNKAFAPLDLAVEDMILTARMTWLIRFDSGLRVLVDGENTAYKLLSASQILSSQLYDKRDDIASIDLRYKNGFAISWK